MPSTVTIERERNAGRAYQERWARFRDLGNKPTLISMSMHPTFWAAWLSYFRAHDLQVQADLMRDGRREMTVPCLNPADFDQATAPGTRESD